MISRGFNSYEKCIALLKIFKQNKIIEISEQDIAHFIAINIGASKYFKTVRNYIDLLKGFNMITLISTNRYKINYSVLDD